MWMAEKTYQMTVDRNCQAFGASLGQRKEDKETQWWNELVQKTIQRTRVTKKKWNSQENEESQPEGGSEVYSKDRGGEGKRKRLPFS